MISENQALMQDILDAKNRLYDRGLHGFARIEVCCGLLWATTNYHRLKTKGNSKRLWPKTRTPS
jgi:hypothetical protein